MKQKNQQCDSPKIFELRIKRATLIQVLNRFCYDQNRNKPKKRGLSIQRRNIMLTVNIIIESSFTIKCKSNFSCVQTHKKLNLSSCLKPPQQSIAFHHVLVQTDMGH